MTAMPIVDLQRRLRELGRIRMGVQVPVGNTGRTRPVKGERFRLTSPTQALIVAAGEKYGGEVSPWTNEGRQEWQVTIDADALPCHVPPQEPLSQWYELWSGGGCQRRCDGVTEQLRMVDCICRARYGVAHEDGTPDEAATAAAMNEAASRRASDGGPDACRPVTRLGVWLHELPGMGVWRLESHGYYAAVELAGVAEFLAVAAAAGKSVPAVLRLTQRRVKRPGSSPKEFVVPALDVQRAFGDLVAALGVGLHDEGVLAPHEPAPALGDGRRGTQRVPLEGQPELPDRTGPPAPAQRPDMGEAPDPTVDSPAREPAGHEVIDVGGQPDAAPPPPPPDEAGPPQPIGAGSRTHRKLMALLSEVDLNAADTRHAVLYAVTSAMVGEADAVDSSSDLTEAQAMQVVTLCDLVAYGLAAWGVDEEGEPAFVHATDVKGANRGDAIALPLDVPAVQRHLANLPEPEARKARREARERQTTLDVGDEEAGDDG